jgi:hypothetical protein
MATRVEVLASAKWQARQHASELDALTAVQWLASLARAWRRLWNRWPEAFHYNGTLVGSLPALPNTDGATLPMDPAWLDVLGAGVAQDAIVAIAAGDPDRAKLLTELHGRLEVVFARGLA